MSAAGIVATGGPGSGTGWGVLGVYVVLGVALGVLGVRAWGRR